jgi:two-component system response regulator HydG
MGNEKGKVLVVDDQRVLRLSLAGIIEYQWYEVTDVEDGYQAIEAVRESNYDLVFMDIKMPGINGVQAFREIKKINPDSVVVMMTGFAVEDLVKDALEEWAFTVVYKPFELERVITLIDSVFKSLLVLVVDDRTADRDVLSEILTDKGYFVATAADGKQAIEMAGDSHYDIIFMDIKMPGMDGLATFEEIKSMNPEARVIFMTGFVVEESLKEALDAGAYPIAYKPLDIDNICGLLAQVSAEKVK